MNPEIIPFKFLVDYQNYPAGEIAGLNFEVGDRLAGSTMRTAAADGTQIVSKVCRRATPADLEAYQRDRHPKQREKPVLVPIRFRKAVGQYRAGEIAGFTVGVAKQYCEGYMVGGPSGQRVHAVADYYVDKIDESLRPEPEAEKPRRVRRPRRKRKQAAMDDQGAPEKK